MRILDGNEELEAIHWFEQAAKVAFGSSCFRAHGGSVIVSGGELVGEGFNGPPAGEKLDRCRKDGLPAGFKSDKTCCVHAEQRAIMDVLSHHPKKLEGSRIYFVRLDSENRIAKSGKPYCTICSKMALDAGIAEYALWHDEGIAVYDTDEYNRLSFQYNGQ